MSIAAVPHPTSLATQDARWPSAQPSLAEAEANETEAVTRQKAAEGDPVAIRKLAKEAERQALLNPPPAQEPGKGGLFDLSA